MINFLRVPTMNLRRRRQESIMIRQQYVKASELFGQVIPRFRATPEAEELNWLNAQSYYGMKQYDMAGSYFKSLVEQYPFGKYAEDATFLAAKCDYNLSPRAELDQENSRNAIEGFTVFINRFPNSPKVRGSQRLYQRAWRTGLLRSRI